MAAKKSEKWVAPKEPKEEKFRLQATAVMLTYKNHLDKENFISWIDNKVTQVIEFIRLAHETGDENNPYLHTHVVIRFQSRINTTCERYFDYNGIHPNIKVINCVGKHYANALKYLSKEDPANEDLKKKERGLIGKLENYENIGDAIAGEAEEWRDVAGIVTAYRFIKPVEYIMEWTPYKWQRELMGMVAPEVRPDGRSVRWLYESTGNAGKTYFSKYMMWKDPRNYYCVNAVGAYKDFACIVNSAFESGWSGHCIILDLPRTMEDKYGMGFFQSIEGMINGMVTSTKYSGATRIWGGCHVVVFANWPPKQYIEDENGVSHLTLSKDRWRITEIGPEEEEEPLWTGPVPL